MINYSPEFTEFSPEAIEACLRDGAAKVGEFLSKESVLALAQKGFIKDEDILFHRAPEFEGVVSLVCSPENIALGMKRAVSSTIVYARRPGETIDAHLDSVARYGLSVLFPVKGGRAYFGADNKPFKLFDSPSNSPRLFWEYGPGDLMLIRQGITEVNGEFVDLHQVRHVGAGSDDRHIQVIDFAADGVSFPISLEGLGGVSGVAGELAGNGVFADH